MWQMSPVADARAAGRAGRRRTSLRIGAGLLGGLVTFVPFGLISASVWGWFQGESSWSGGGWAVTVIGLAAGMGVASFVASEG